MVKKQIIQMDLRLKLLWLPLKGNRPINEIVTEYNDARSLLSQWNKSTQEKHKYTIIKLFY